MLLTEPWVSAPEHCPDSVTFVSLTCVNKRHGNSHMQIPTFKYSLRRENQECSHLDSYLTCPRLRPLALPVLDSLSPSQDVQDSSVPKRFVSVGFLAQTQHLLLAACLHPDGWGHK